MLRLRMIVTLMGGVSLGVMNVSAGDVATLGSELAALTQPRSEMVGVIERFSADRGAQFRAYPPEFSSVGQLKRARFYRDWAQALQSVEFENLSRDAQIDYLLLRSMIETDGAELELRAKRRAEARSLAPFAEAIAELEAARSRLEPIDPEKLAGVITKLTAEVEQARRKLAGSARPEPGGSSPGNAARIAARGAELVGETRRTLATWFGFYNGYDPLFTWWLAEPYQALDRALETYNTSLRDRAGLSRPNEGETARPQTATPAPFARGAGRGFGGPGRFGGGGGAGGSDDDTVEPIGNEGLLVELKQAWIPYTPEELLAIADTEFAWCEAEMKKAARDLGFGDDWKAALELVKTKHVEPGKQPALIRDLAEEAVRFIDEHDLVTVPPLARETWRMDMMSPERQRVTPFFTGGEVISVAFPTNSMSHEQKVMSLRGNNVHFARATVHHELMPGHHLQQFMNARYHPYRQVFRTPFWIEGWALYWEMLLWDKNFPKSAEDRVGMLFWRMHRCARIVFSLKYHLGKMTPKECVDYLVDKVGHERENAAGEVRRSFNGSYGPLYQCAYMVGGLQIRALHHDLVDSGKLTDRAFHDTILQGGPIPIELVRFAITDLPMKRDTATTWRFGSK